MTTLDMIRWNRRDAKRIATLALLLALAVASCLATPPDWPNGRRRLFRAAHQRPSLANVQAEGSPNVVRRELKTLSLFPEAPSMLADKAPEVDPTQPPQPLQPLQPSRLRPLGSARAPLHQLAESSEDQANWLRLAPIWSAPAPPRATSRGWEARPLGGVAVNAARTSRGLSEALELRWPPTRAGHSDGQADKQPARPT